MSSPFSPFSSKLGTNYCPTDEEITEIQSLIVEPALRMQSLDDEIADLQKAIDKLAEERASLDAYVESHKALISPVRRLPLDVIQEILVACIPTHRNCVMSAREAPVLLGRICSSWRAISLSTPRIWASLHVVEPKRPRDSTSTSFDEKLAQRLETMKTWLGRSGECPLSISLLAISPRTSTASPTSPDTFLKALIPFALRWQYIHFTVPCESVLEPLLHLAATDVPMLQSVALYPRQRPHRLEWVRFGMLSGPQISSFSIPASSFSPIELPLRWNQLTVMEITGSPWNMGPSSETILDTMSKCPLLRSCKLVIKDEATTAVSPDCPIVECPFLHTLNLSCLGVVASAFSFLLPRLSLPELRDFTLSGDLRSRNGVVEDSPALATFLAASTQLEFLQIGTNAFSQSSLLQVIRGLPPTMQHLRLIDITIRDSRGSISSLDDDVLEALTPSPGLAGFSCPALQSLVIQSGLLISPAAVQWFITARMSVESRTPLKRVNIHFARNPDLDILPSIQPFIEAGLEVTIQHPPPQPSPFSPWIGLVGDAP
ncbi:hypothetical protein C8R44DRAFT_761888 [Mycena epipterygia]|nr:hypothetical protein C8R44DRAFT_761888 [Mycena epipterygia]